MTRYYQGFEGAADGSQLSISSQPQGAAIYDGGWGNLSTAIRSSSSAHSGSLGAQLTAADGQGDWLVFQVAPATATTRVTTRVYFSVDTTVGTATPDSLLAFFDAAQTYPSPARINLANGGILQLKDKANAIWASSPAISAGTIYRLEAYCQPGTTTANGQLGVALYLGDSATPLWTYSTTTANCGTAKITGVSIGRDGGNNLTTATGPRRFNFDDWVGDDAMTSGWIGVAAAQVTVNANPNSSPPQFEITIASPDGSAMQSATLYRVTNGKQTLTRVQPSTTTGSVFVTDTEAPWDTPVSYTASITYANGNAAAVGTSSPATLTPTTPAIWAIHPQNPSLSLVLDAGLFSQLGIAADGDLVYAAQATQHRIMGSKLPILTKVGTRLAPAWSLEITSTTLQELTALLALLDDETPILIRSPSAWGWAIPEGYYAVGDVDVARRLQYGPEPSRTIKLPLQQVAAPAGGVVSTWGWGGLMSAYPDWPSVQAAYADWGKVAGNQPT